MIQNLPDWILPNMKPSFNELESATAIEMVYKLYGKNQELIDDYIKFVEDIKNEVNAFKTSTNKDMECFKENITKICNDYIKTMDMKIDCQDRKIAEAVKYMKDNIKATVTEIIAEMKEKGEIDEAILNVFDNIGTRFENLYVESIEKMKNTEYMAGDVVKTLGYYQANDGGQGLYRIRDKQETDVEDGGTIYVLNNGLVAELIIENVVNVKQFGAKGDGETDDTLSIQNAIDKVKTVLIPDGTFKISQLTINKRRTTIIGNNPESSILKSDSINYGIILPASSDHCNLRNFQVTSGIEIGVQGTATVQDISNILENIKVLGGDGIKVHHRGNYLKHVSVGSANYGFFVSGTDNTLDSCVAAVINKHGFAVTNGNNLINTSKAFCCGFTEYGAGFYIAGAFARLIGCESQQNYYENYVIKNSNGSVISGCISDGAFWKCDGDTYKNNEYGTINTSSVYIHNIEGCQIDIVVINGSKFGDGYGKTKDALGFLYYSIKNNSINLTIFNRNNFKCELASKSLIRLLASNKIVVGGNDFNNFISNMQIYKEKTVSFTANTQETKAVLSQKISHDTKKISCYIEKVDDKTKLTSLLLDVMCTLVKDGTTIYKNTSSNALADATSVEIDLESYLASQDYDSITSIAVRIMARNNTDLEAFDYSIYNVKLAQIENTIEL